ncbi:MAG: hypothetical protein ABIG93_04705 [archaeon]|nr:hypothetical protein [Nanoarchaeota archaeon]
MADENNPEQLNDIYSLGHQIYDSLVDKFKEHEGQCVAINVRTRDYGLGTSPLEAADALAEIVGEDDPKSTYLIKIGPDGKREPVTGHRGWQGLRMRL